MTPSKKQSQTTLDNFFSPMSQPRRRNSQSQLNEPLSLPACTLPKLHTPTRPTPNAYVLSAPAGNASQIKGRRLTASSKVSPPKFAAYLDSDSEEDFEEPRRVSSARKNHHTHKRVLAKRPRVVGRSEEVISLCSPNDEGVDNELDNEQKGGNALKIRSRKDLCNGEGSKKIMPLEETVVKKLDFFNEDFEKEGQVYNNPPATPKCLYPELRNLISDDDSVSGLENGRRKLKPLYGVLNSDGSFSEESDADNDSDSDDVPILKSSAKRRMLSQRRSSQVTPQKSVVRSQPNPASRDRKRRAQMVQKIPPSPVVVDLENSSNSPQTPVYRRPLQPPPFAPTPTRGSIKRKKVHDDDRVLSEWYNERDIQNFSDSEGSQSARPPPRAKTKRRKVTQKSLSVPKGVAKEGAKAIDLNLTGEEDPIDDPHSIEDGVALGNPSLPPFDLVGYFCKPGENTRDMITRVGEDRLLDAVIKAEEQGMLLCFTALSYPDKVIHQLSVC